MSVVSYRCCFREPEKLDSRVAELQQRLADSDKQKHEQLEAMRKKHQTEIDVLKKQPSKVVQIITGVLYY